VSKSKAEMMKRLYHERKAEGLTLLKEWVTAEEKKELLTRLEELRK